MTKNFVENDYRRKIKTPDELHEIIGSHPREQKVVMCHGTFDIVHPGHIRHLIYARDKGDILVVSLTCDAHISKANMRPFVPEELRAMNLAVLEVVDYVIVDPHPTPLESLGKIQPDYFVKGYEYVEGEVNPKTQEEKKVIELYGGEFIFTPGDIVYSSSAIIEVDPPDLATEKLAILLDGESLTFDDLYSALDKLAALSVYVVGDTIVDTLTQTTLIGASAKTPTFSCRYEGRADFVGGAGIVAKHLCAAGADVTFSTVLGDDALKDYVLEDLVAAGIEAQAVIDPTRPTTNKNSFVAGGYRLLKVDTLDNRAVSEKIVAQLCDSLGGAKVDAVVFSDFRHGIFSRETISTMVEAIPEGVFRVGDSQVASRWGNILDFSDFDLITPNEKEARFALGDQDTVVRPLGSELYRQARCKTLMLKMGERGLITFRAPVTETADSRQFFVLDSFAGHVMDAVGSGDALLAYATLAMKATGNEVIASVLGSLAAGVECEKDGNIPVSPDDVRRKLKDIEKHANYS
jgi:rfaE bifunctional protein kinase chain/domain/rfaE bifunctional protein nucleotidyltransferase chain/domain